MAIDSENKRRSATQVFLPLNVLPMADGAISVFDRRHASGRYRGLPVPVALSGGLTPTGAVARALTAYRSFGGGLTPSGVLGTLLTAYRSFGGSITPTGSLAPVVTFVQALLGELVLTGVVSAHNPLWLLIDETLRWMGEWSATYSYDLDDVVLHQTTDANEWHVFISKASHNVGNIPTSSAAWWRRLFQEPLA